MKSGERPKLVRGLRQESRRFRLLVIVVGFFLVSLTFVVISKPDAILFSRKYRIRRRIIQVASLSSATRHLRFR